MRSKLSATQRLIMEQLIAGPKTVKEITEALGCPDNSIRGALASLKEVHECVHVKDYVKGSYRVKCALFAAGKGEDIKYPYAERDTTSLVAKKVKDEIHAQAQELKRKKAIAQLEMKQHLQKQNTPFGWLLENANGNDARG